MVLIIGIGAVAEVAAEDVLAAILPPLSKFVSMQVLSHSALLQSLSIECFK